MRSDPSNNDSRHGKNGKDIEEDGASSENLPPRSKHAFVVRAQEVERQ